MSKTNSLEGFNPREHSNFEVMQAVQAIVDVVNSSHSPAGPSFFKDLLSSICKGEFPSPTGLIPTGMFALHTDSQGLLFLHISLKDLETGILHNVTFAFEQIKSKIELGDYTLPKDSWASLCAFDSENPIEPADSRYWMMAALFLSAGLPEEYSHFNCVITF